MLLKQPYKKKNILHFKSQSWLHDIGDEEDEEAVAALHFKALASIPTPIVCDEDFKTNVRIHKTNSMSDLIFREGEILGPQAIYYRKTSEIDVIFCERVTSYTKTFDMTFVIGQKTETHSCMDRKTLKDITAWAKQNSLKIYETGPDPLPWKRMFAFHEEQSWDDIHRLLTHQSSEEEEASEWEEDMTDPEDEDDHDFEEDSEEDSEEEEYESEEEDSEPATKRRRVLSDSDNED
jgi:hypothetical protein